MSYIYGQPFRQRDGWYYWGKHFGKVPEHPGPFETEGEAKDHARTCGYGKAKKELKYRPKRKGSR